MSILEAQKINVGDLVNVGGGPLTGCNVIVTKIELTLNTLCPRSGWHGGPAIQFGTDLGTVHHFNVENIRHKGWALGL
jgi:hypothetical protein